MKSRVLTIALAASTVLLLVSLALNMWLSWQIYWIGGWRDEVYGLVGMTATRQALDDYREGHLRLYILGGENEKRHYIGTNDGPFEVWIPQFYPSLGRAHRYSTERFIEFYNRKMRYMHTHPDRFRRKSEDVQPTDPPNDGPTTPVDDSDTSGGGRHR